MGGRGEKNEILMQIVTNTTLPLYHRTILGKTQVNLRHISGRSQVDLRYISGPKGPAMTKKVFRIL